MKMNTFKAFAAVSALALGLAIAPMTARAAGDGNETVTAKITTNRAIASTQISDLNFGKWFIAVRGNNPTLIMDADGAITTGAVGTSTLTSLDNATVSKGEMSIDVPAATTMTITRTASTPFTDTNITLTGVTFKSGASTGTLNADLATGSVDITTPGGQSITFGATLTFLATPDDTKSPHNAGSFDVSLAY